MKKFCTPAALLFLNLSLFSQPANDNCAGAIHLGEAPVCPVSDTFHNVDATASTIFSEPGDNVPICFVGSMVERDVWFSFDVPASGGAVDFTLTVNGVAGPDGSLKQPQAALYRGDCEIDGLEEINCAAALPNQSLTLDMFGLTPGQSYFLRISDWSASGSPNWGDFVLCIEEYDPVFTLGSANFASSCAGTLFDSGGPTGDYSNNQNQTFTICPQDVHECILINVLELATETNFDNLSFFAGNNTNAPQIAKLDGFASNIEIQMQSQCVTLLFSSDNVLVDEGFELTWQCTAEACTVAPPSTCSNPTVIPGLPYAANDLTTCGTGNEIMEGPCNNDDFLATEDYVFTYQSPGDECIGVSVTGSNAATGVGIYDACPDVAMDCIGQSGGGLGQSDPSINAAYLDQAGTYYIVVDNANNCTPFSIAVQEVACPVVFPSAANCEDALSLNGCGDLPAIVSVAPGDGEPGFISFFNLGCWGVFFPLNYTWFYFQAQADGEFGFVLQAANPDEASDIDFQIWGPVSSPAGACDFAQFNQPARSSYADGANPTGLTNQHPATGNPVTDVCEDANGDDFVKPLQVETGEYYLVLINDWGDQIVSGAVAIDFEPTTPGVLGPAAANFTVSPDVMVCPGESAQLFATGAEVYNWFPATGLSCTHCPNPVATVSQTTVYNVAVFSLCNADTLQVEVSLLDVDAGPDQTLCLNEQIQLQAGVNAANVSYNWTGPAGFLSCNNCPNPVLTAAAAGTFTITATATTPDCSASDALTVTVLPSPAPVFTISEDQQICQGTTVLIGGAATAGVTYSWTSDPGGFVSSQANPSVTPVQTTVYYLEASTAGCPIVSLDSVLVQVDSLPSGLGILPADTLICEGGLVLLGSPGFDSSSFSQITFQWSPVEGQLTPDSLVNLLVQPGQTTTYQRITTNGFCKDTAFATVTVVASNAITVTPDQAVICSGESVQLHAASPYPISFSWEPSTGLSCSDCPDPIATPGTTTSYAVSGEFEGCPVQGSVTIEVFVPPFVVFPENVLCPGDSITLNLAPDNSLSYAWTATDPAFISLSPAPSVSPVATTTYFVLVSNGVCPAVADSITIFVADNPLLSVSNDTVVCSGQPVILFADGGIPGTYLWQPGAGMEPSFLPSLQPGVNTVTVTFTTPCFSLTDSVVVEVVPGIEILEITSDKPDTVFQGTTVVLDVETSIAAQAYMWSSGSTSDTAQVKPFVVPAETYAVTVTDELGCTDTLSISITVLSSRYDIPNIFTPNGDGVNDVFKVIAAGENVSVLSMQIFNRWGQKVFDRENSNEGWDGKQDGEPALSDVYIYSIRLLQPDGEPVTKKGDLTLVR